jgi:hypothetical protein
MAAHDIPSEEMSIKGRHDPGGKVSIPLPDHVRGTGILGGITKEYRYRLGRTWELGPCVMFVMMNPSTADPLADNPTVAKCRRFATKWGYGSMYVGNTFAYRAADQARLAEVNDPIGPENDNHLLAMARESELVVFAYGQPKHRRLKDRGIAVARLLHQRNNSTSHSETVQERHALPSALSPRKH